MNFEIGWVKRLKVNGFIIFDHKETYPQFIEEVTPFIQKQQIIYKEDIRIGLSNAPLAFIDLLSGRNFGKMLVKVGDWFLSKFWHYFFDK